MRSPDEPIYYAHKRFHDGSPVYYHLSPDRWWVEIHGTKDPIVATRVRERRDGEPESIHWGWMYMGDNCVDKQNRYQMIWPSLIQLKMCFPYGLEVEEKQSRGRRVNLIVEEITESL